MTMPRNTLHPWSDGNHVPLGYMVVLGLPVPINADAPAELLGNESIREFWAVSFIGHAEQRAVATQVVRVPELLCI